MCFPPTFTLLLMANDSEVATLSCPLPSPHIASQGPQTRLAAAAIECGARENEMYSVTVRAENQFGLFSTSAPVTICECGLYCFR